MTLQIQDRVKETTTTTGTGALSLAGAVTGFQAFSAVCANGDTCYYALQQINSAGVPTGSWECGVGTYTTSGNTLTRTTVTASSNSGSVVSLAAGTTQVWIDITASAFNLDKVQVGTLAVYAGATIPTGYLAVPTAATTVSRTTYAALFAVLGTTWGAGDGSTTFGIPWIAPGGAPVATGAGGFTLGFAGYSGLQLTHDHTYQDLVFSTVGAVSGADVGVMSFVEFTGGPTGSTGGSANYASGSVFNMCIKY
jgi:hypothetical protein